MSKQVAATVVEMTVTKLMEASEYKKLRYASKKPTIHQIRQWIEDGELPGEVKGGMWFVDVHAALMGTDDPLLRKMIGA